MKSALLDALAGRPPSHIPIWIMRQAGRYLPEYRASRARAGSFLKLCQTPELACEVTLQPLRRFALDAAILFSDILTIPDAFELGLEFVEGEGPRLSKPIQSPEQIELLPQVDVRERLHYVGAACGLIRRELASELPLIGFAGSPFTLAAYMIEGKGSKDFAAVRGFAYRHPQAFQLLLDKLVDAVTDYLLMQIASGVQLVQIFDTWGGTLTSAAYHQLSLEPMRRIIARLKQQQPTTPIIIFTKGGANWLTAMAASGADALGLDWSCDIAHARACAPRLCLQGNLDPAALLGPKEHIAAEVRSICAQMRGQPHIFNLGHGITPNIDPDQVAYLVDCVHSWQPE